MEAFPGQQDGSTRLLDEADLDGTNWKWFTSSVACPNPKVLSRRRSGRLGCG